MLIKRRSTDPVHVLLVFSCSPIQQSNRTDVSELLHVEREATPSSSGTFCAVISTLLLQSRSLFIVCLRMLIKVKK